MQGWYAAGYWKDFAGRRLLCEELHASLVQTFFDPNNLHECVQLLNPDTTDVIVEYSTFPSLITILKSHRPGVRVHVRAHNAEALQHLHRLPVSFRPSLEGAKRLYGAARLLLQDRRSARNADNLLSISSFDSANYWSWLTSKEKVCDLPYFSPWPELRPQVAPCPVSDRKNQIVCMPGGWDRLSQQQRHNFLKLAEATHTSASENIPKFLITDYTNDDFVRSRFCESLGTINEPWDLLCESRGLAVLTDLGFGMKTTIVDAIAAGCLVFVMPKLIKRLPEIIRTCCIPIDPHAAGAELVMLRALNNQAPTVVR